MDTIVSIVNMMDLNDLAVWSSVSRLLHEVTATTKELVLTNESRPLMPWTVVDEARRVARGILPQEKKLSEAQKAGPWRAFYQILRMTTARVESIRIIDWMDQLEYLYLEYPDVGQACCDLLTRQGKVTEVELVTGGDYHKLPNIYEYVAHRRLLTPKCKKVILRGDSWNWRMFEDVLCDWLDKESDIRVPLHTLELRSGYHDLDTNDLVKLTALLGRRKPEHRPTRLSLQLKDMTRGWPAIQDDTTRRSLATVTAFVQSCPNLVSLRLTGAKLDYATMVVAHAKTLTDLDAGDSSKLESLSRLTQLTNLSIRLEEEDVTFDAFCTAARDLPLRSLDIYVISKVVPERLAIWKLENLGLSSWLFPEQWVQFERKHMPNLKQLSGSTQIRPEDESDQKAWLSLQLPWHSIKVHFDEPTNRRAWTSERASKWMNEWLPTTLFRASDTVQSVYVGDLYLAIGDYRVLPDRPCRQLREFTFMSPVAWIEDAKRVDDRLLTNCVHLERLVIDARQHHFDGREWVKPDTMIRQASTSTWIRKLRRLRNVHLWGVFSNPDTKDWTDYAWETGNRVMVST